MKLLATALTAGATLLSGVGKLRVEGIVNRSGYGYVLAHVQDEGGRRRDLQLPTKALVEVVSEGRREK